MSTELSRKKRVRAGHRASATKMVRKAGELLSEENPDITKLTLLRMSLGEKLDVLKQLDSEFLDIVDEEDVADEIDQSDEFREDIYTTLVRIERVLASTPSSSSTPSVARDSATGPHPSGRSMGRVRLPKLTIPSFDGELTAWTPFWDAYKSAIHDNPDLTDIDKFNYLRSLLERTALESISGLTLTATNYREAITILEKRFGDKRRIVAKHMDALLNIEAVTSQFNLKGLRRLYDLVESHVRSLKSLGVAADSYGGLLASVLLNKIPQELQLIVSRKIGSGDWELDALMKVMEEEIRARERTVAVSTTTVKKPGREPQTAAALFAGNSSGPICCYCQQAHTSNSCGVISQPHARKNTLLKSGRCFVCLRRGHISRECRSTMKCSRCSGRHHISLCTKGSDTTPQRQTDSAVAVQPPKVNQPATTQPRVDTSTVQRAGLNTGAPAFPSQNPRATALWVNSHRAVLLQTAQALAFNPNAPQLSRQVRLVLDSGSQRSYVTERVMRELLLTPEGRQPMTILTFGSNEEQQRVCEFVKLSLALKGGRAKQLTLFTVPLICEPLTCQPGSFCQENFSHLSGLDLADPCSDGHSRLEVDILVGSDQYWELVTGDTRRGSTGPVAINTELGWVLSGPAASPTRIQPSTCLVTHTLRVDGLPEDLQVLDDRLKSFWELESFGISGSEHTVCDDFGSSVRFVDGRYEVELPWKEAHPMLADNYNLCLQRLRGLIRRLKQDPAILQEYNATIQDHIRRGIVEAVRSSEEVPERIHYLPHHAIIRRDKETTKLRVVYDASAHSHGPSLNDCLHAGPKFDQKILDILLRFRKHRIAITADIEKAFLMVSMARKDRDVLRFLWFDDVFADQSDVIELRFARVMFGVSSSPFLLNATIRHHIEQYSQNQSDLVQKLSKSIYVDDIVTGADDEDRAHQVFKDSKEILKDGGFNLRKFCSNSASLQAKVELEEMGATPEQHAQETRQPDETYTSSTLGCGQKMRTGEQKVLGVRWNVSSDQLVVNLDEISSTARRLEPTKRNITSLVGKFYDPLGFLSPVVVQFKMFFQELCGAKLEWDQPLTGRLLGKWHSLRTGLEEGQSFSIPRCYLEGISEQLVSCTLCGFCDASLKAYAGVVYLVLETETGYSVRFVAAKTRVSPLKEQTIPRLELLSALLLARLLASVTQSLNSEMQLSPPRCFTDSTVAQCWIRGTDKTWKPFVQNRVVEIRKLVPPDAWKHCPGSHNPADIPSRGLAPLELSVNVLWRDGPDWLREGDLGCDHEVQFPKECLSELRAKDLSLVHGMFITEDAVGLGQIIKCTDFSCLDRLLSVTALVLRFCRTLQDKIHSEAAEYSCNENSKAEELWIMESQRMVAADRRFKQWQKQFELFRETNGVWRCRGRIQNAAVSYSTKHPILLHNDHHFATLCVRKAHERVLHNGVKETLTELRSKFWIIKGRSFVKKVLYQCHVCRRHEGKPYHAPPPPPLPSFRVDEAPPFSFTGVDFAGPLYVKSGDGSRKVWVCLYTCCVVRAVHLDLVPDLSTPAFLRSLKRFTARRGLPSKILSDNAKTFKAAAKAIHAVVSHVDVQRYLAGLGVKWIFNIPRAPWWGGVFERMVRSMKRCLKKIVGQARFSHDELLTALTEVEMVINSRPLSYISADDMEEPLTPSHLMIGRRLMTFPDHLCHEPDDFEATPDLLNRRARYLSTTLDKFWERWRKEYLVELRESHRHHRGDTAGPHVSVGDVVLVHNDDQPRGLWKLGRIEETLIGADGEIRGASLRVTGRGGRTTRLRRPVQRLYPLEVSSLPLKAPDTTREPGTPDDASEDGPNAETTESVQLRRSTRSAALRARDRLLAQTLSEDC